MRRTYSDARIDFLVNNIFKEIIEYNPYIDNIIVYEKNNSIYENNFIKQNIPSDYKIIDLQNNIRSTVFRHGIYSEIAKMNKRRLQKLSMVYLKKMPEIAKQIPILYIETAKKFDVEYDGNGLEIWLPEEKFEKKYVPATRKNNHEIKKIAIAPGAKHATKRWLPEYFAELIDKLNHNYSLNFYLLGGIDDVKICSEIMNFIKIKKANIFDCSGQTSILQTVTLIDNCDLLISNDSSIMHIGAARNVPTIAIFGSTVPQFGFSPFHVKNVICEINIKCRPCTHIGLSKCPQKHFNCMKLLAPDMILETIDYLIKKY